MKHVVTVTASGPCGSGKSAVLGEIEIAMQALGVPVRYLDDPAATLDDMPPPTSPEQPQQECRP